MCSDPGGPHPCCVGVLLAHVWGLFSLLLHGQHVQGVGHQQVRRQISTCVIPVHTTPETVLRMVLKRSRNGSNEHFWVWIRSWITTFFCVWTAKAFSERFQLRTVKDVFSERFWAWTVAYSSWKECSQELSTLWHETTKRLTTEGL